MTKLLPMLAILATTLIITNGLDMLDIKISFNGTSFEREVSENDELRAPAAGGSGPLQNISTVGGENPRSAASSMTGGSAITTSSFSPMSSESAMVSSPGFSSLPSVSANESRVFSLMSGSSMISRRSSSGVAGPQSGQSSSPSQPIPTTSVPGAPSTTSPMSGSSSIGATGPPVGGFLSPAPAVPPGSLHKIRGLLGVGRPLEDVAVLLIGNQLEHASNLCMWASVGSSRGYFRGSFESKPWVTCPKSLPLVRTGGAQLISSIVVDKEKMGWFSICGAEEGASKLGVMNALPSIAHPFEK
ncbi:hypothetical protein B0H13DRAFT_1884180 [Mycena leptocephala]|nr:hypothetical protein B0H13DRAFT_1884180 [Mycena leptocephala]